MKKLTLTFVTIFLMVPVACACEPCAEMLDFEETAKQADLIVVAKKILDGPATSEGTPGIGGPDWIEIQITEVLKGQIDQEKIKVNSWDGMCPYGLVLNDENFITFLVQRDGAAMGEDYQFDSVNFNCCVKYYLKKGKNVLFEDEEISYDNFLERLNSILKAE